MPDKDLTCDVLVIGSGPGGANTAYLLAQAGRDVLLVEEGRHVPIDEVPGYSLEEMNRKYRNAGMTVAFGKPKISYIEGCCVGGASEINAGLYHYPLGEVIDGWAKRYGIVDFGEKELRPYFAACEQDIPVSAMPQGVGPASRILQTGAQKLNWKTTEILRCWKYEKTASGTWRERRQTMTETVIPKALAQGCRLLAGTRVGKILFDGRRARVVLARTIDEDGHARDVRIRFRDVFVCAGAVQTPALLRRSGVRRNVGNTLRMHPAVRVVARFDRPVHDEREGVPVVQVQEFKPRITLGGSYSGLPHLALWMAGKQKLSEALGSWENLAIFYALVTGTGRGRVRTLPFVDDPLVSLDLTPEDLLALGDGLRKLGTLLFASGAVEILPPAPGLPVFRSVADLGALKDGLPRQVDASTIHLFCSCPMGEDPAVSAVDSRGKLHGYENIFLNDASILPDTPGVNPQALIMAIARRNTRYYLETHEKGVCP